MPKYAAEYDLSTMTEIQHVGSKSALSSINQTLNGSYLTISLLAANGNYNVKVISKANIIISYEFYRTNDYPIYGSVRPNNLITYNTNNISSGPYYINLSNNTTFLDGYSSYIYAFIYVAI